MFDVNELKNKVLDGYKVTKEDAMNLIEVPLDDLASAANEIRKSFCGNKSMLKAVDAVKTASSVLNQIIMILI